MAFLGFFGFLGRSRELRELDLAFRAVDLHPQLVPEALKLAMLKLLAGEPGDSGRAASLVAYCMLGAQAFADANGVAQTEEMERRIETGMRAGDSIDAQLILLTLHAGVIQQSVAAEFGLRAD